MKYIAATVMLAVPDEEYEAWSEHSDWTFTLARAFHNPERGMYLIAHDYEKIPAIDAEQKKFSIITEEGGI